MIERLEEGSVMRRPLLSDQSKPILEFENGDSRVTADVIFSTFVAVCGSLCYGCAMGYSSAAQAGIMEDLGLSVGAYSVFGSLLTLGGFIGAVFVGKIAALFGRKNGLLISEIFCIIGWITIAFAEDTIWLGAGRLLLGIGVGFISYLVPVYIAEITPKHVRGTLAFANPLLQNCGVAMNFVIGNFIHWRIIAIIGVVPCVVQVIGLFFVPESPRWLAKVGRTKEFEISLQRLRGKDANISREASEIKDIIEQLDEDPKGGFFDLFQRRYMRALTVGVGLMLLQQLSGSTGISYYASSIFKLAGFPTAIGTTLLALILVPKALLGLILVDKCGRRPLLMFSGVGMFFSCLLVGVSFILQGREISKELTPIFIFIGILVFNTTFAIGLGGLPWIIMSEIFPLNIKVSAGSLVTMTNWSTGWFVTITFNLMLAWCPSGTFFIFAGVCALTILFTWLLVPETIGLTLEEIQASFTQTRY